MAGRPTSSASLWSVTERRRLLVTTTGRARPPMAPEVPADAGQWGRSVPSVEVLSHWGHRGFLGDPSNLDKGVKCRLRPMHFGMYWVTTLCGQAEPELDVSNPLVDGFVRAERSCPQGQAVFRNLSSPSRFEFHGREADSDRGLRRC